MTLGEIREIDWGVLKGAGGSAILSGEESAPRKIEK